MSRKPSPLLPERIATGSTATARWGRILAALVPLVLVNLVAFAAQLTFLRTHLPWPLAGQVTVAVALESVAVFLALHAHVAALTNDSALRLRLASYGFAAVIAAMNYSHYAGPHWRPTFTALAVGLMSASSPWLWGVHSRRVSRDALMAAGLVEPHALRLGVTRWAWHPLRSACVMFDATWAGVTDPREAVSRWEARHGSSAPVAQPEPTEALTVPVTVPEVAPTEAHLPVADALETAARSTVPEAPAPSPSKRVKSAPEAPVIVLHPLDEFAPEIAAGVLPSKRQVQKRMHVAWDKAGGILAELEQAISERADLVPANGSGPVSVGSE